MTQNYKKLDFSIDIDIKRLKNETLTLFDNDKLFAYGFEDQIGLTYENDENQNKFTDAVGSLDWDYANWTDEDQKNGLPPPKNTRNIREHHFDKIVPELKDTYIYEIVKKLQQEYNIGRTRLMRSLPKTCLTWHVDSTPRLHIPIITNERCFMVWENCTQHLEEGMVYWADTTVPHTAMNASFEERIHLVATLPG